MIIAVSPYHLTTREPAAMAALLLGQRVVTMLPAAVGEHGGLPGQSAQETARRVPSYRQFVDSWAWSVPLWKAGVLHASLGSATPIDDMWAVVRHMQEDPAWAPLRGFLRHDFFADEASYLAAVATDLLKGGPDPGLSLPVAAGLDRFATRVGAGAGGRGGGTVVVARSRATSLAQQAETELGAPLFRVALPCLLQGSAERIVHWREELEPQRRAWWGVVARIAQRLGDSREENVVEGEDLSELQDAASALAEAHRARRGVLLEGSADDDVRAVEGTISIAAVRLPWDAVLTSSLRALERAVGPRAARALASEAAPSTAAATIAANLPALHDGVRGRSFMALLIKPMGQPERRGR